MSQKLVRQNAVEYKQPGFPCSLCLFGTCPRCVLYHTNSCCCCLCDLLQAEFKELIPILAETYEEHFSILDRKQLENQKKRMPSIIYIYSVSFTYKKAIIDKIGSLCACAGEFSKMVFCDLVSEIGQGFHVQLSSDDKITWSNFFDYFINSLLHDMYLDYFLSNKD